MRRDEAAPRPWPGPVRGRPGHVVWYRRSSGPDWYRRSSGPSRPAARRLRPAAATKFARARPARAGPPACTVASRSVSRRVATAGKSSQTRPARPSVRNAGRAEAAAPGGTRPLRRRRAADRHAPWRKGSERREWRGPGAARPRRAVLRACARPRGSTLGRRLAPSREYGPALIGPSEPAPFPPAGPSSIDARPAIRVGRAKRRRPSANRRRWDAGPRSAPRGPVDPRP